MPLAFATRAPLVVALGCTTLAIGLHLLSESDADSDSDGSTPVVQLAAAASVAAPRIAPAVQVIDDDLVDDEPDAIRGHAPIDDPAEFAFVFEVAGTTYLRLSTDERASARGTPKMIAGEPITVIAPVATAAMPAHLRSWAGRSVLVDNGCEAHVVGFAEVSRVAGEPPGTFDGDLPEDDNEPREPREQPEWTIENVVNDNVVLAARLDDCSGSWARARSFPAAAQIERVRNDGAESAARADLLARSAVDPIQDDWKRDGGEGNWRDSTQVHTYVYAHEQTEEEWVIAQASHPGYCGEPNVNLMAVYRANPDGSVRRVATLDYGQSNLVDVVDLDGDGQPEFVMGDGDDGTNTNLVLVDLLGESHASIDVPVHYSGCGC